MVPDNSDEFPDGTLLADFWCRSSWTIDFQNSDESYLCIQNRGFLILKVDRPKSLYYDYIVDKDEDRDSSSV